MLFSYSLALLLSQAAAEPAAVSVNVDEPPAAAQQSLERIVVTGARPLSSIELAKNPKAPQQPLPAHDGADYLKSITLQAVMRVFGALTQVTVKPTTTKMARVPKSIVLTNAGALARKLSDPVARGVRYSSLLWLR